MTNPNFKYLFEGISSDVVSYLVERDSMSIQEALKTFYLSDTFEKLSDPETNLYIESPAYIYSMLWSELRSGRLTQ